jgi:hypothetical protein
VLALLVGLWHALPLALRGRRKQARGRRAVAGSLQASH